MPTEDEMTVTERRKYLKRMKPLYAKAERSEQSRMLTEMEQVTGLHRKSLLRLLHAPTLSAKSARKEEDAPMGWQLSRRSWWSGKAWIISVQNGSPQRFSRRPSTWPALGVCI